ncbi:MAG TPA: hypothetical protein PK854_07985 [Oscillospiraceae bacterium]|nr:hypothetical protein [Oscillospiraceae bacterium]HPS35190.1 hypothetical protein [Oscillospiraceae bacterium]
MGKIYKLFVVDKLGVLDRIVGIIRRCGWNISVLITFEAEPGKSVMIIKLDKGQIDDALTKRLEDIESIYSIAIEDDTITRKIAELGV